MKLLILAAKQGCGVVVCNFNVYLLAAGTPVNNALGIRRFKAPWYILKRCANIDWLTSWLDMKLGVNWQTKEEMHFCKKMADVFSTPQIKAGLGSG
jgi:hypothetical protein